MDAVVQVIEPYLSNRANDFSDALARPAIARGLTALHGLSHGEDATARDELAWVSLSGGLALANAGLGAVHGLAGPIGGMSKAAHGAVCGSLLPFDNPAAPRLTEVEALLSDAFGGGPGSTALNRWSRVAGLPASSRDLDCGRGSRDGRRSGAGRLVNEG